jgi:hypothetical protein
MKVRIKTIDELKATPGVILGGTTFRGPINTIPERMAEELCGKVVTVDTNGAKGTLVGRIGGWGIEEWMTVGKPTAFQELYDKLNN